MTEKEIEKSIIDSLRWMGIYCQKVQSGSILKQYSDKRGKSKAYRINLADTGTPDIIGCVKGKFFAIEVKKDQKEIEKWLKQKDERAINQHNEHEKIRKAGGEVIVASSIEEVVEDLKYLDFL